MDPKSYFNRFLVSEREDKLFVLMPFINKCQKRYEEIIKPTAEFINLKPEVSDDEKSGKEIVEKIYSGINSSRILLFDLSSDERYGNKVNSNVAYELGIARMIRGDTDIILITDIEDIEKEIFFDIRGMNIIKIKQDFNKEKFYEDLKSIHEKQKYYEDARIELVSKLIDGEGIDLMYKYGRLPIGYKHFSTRGLPAEIKMSALRLLDVGAITTEFGCYEKGYEYAYHWTPLGRAVMEYMGIKEISLDEFKKLPLYQDYLFAEEKYKEFKKNI